MTLLLSPSKADQPSGGLGELWLRFGLEFGDWGFARPRSLKLLGYPPESMSLQPTLLLSPSKADLPLTYLSFFDFFLMH